MRQRRGALITFAPEGETHQDTKTCCHCNGVQLLPKGRPIDETMEFCLKCGEYCHARRSECLDGTTGRPLEGCRPFELWLEMTEAEGRRLATQAQDEGLAVTPPPRPSIYDIWQGEGLKGDSEIGKGFVCCISDTLEGAVIALFWEEAMARAILPHLNAPQRGLLLFGTVSMQARYQVGPVNAAQIALALRARFTVVNKLADRPVCQCFDEKRAEQLRDLLNQWAPVVGADTLPPGGTRWKM